jgi:hypothetical protein
MDEKIDKIRDLLKIRKEKYPNITSVWAKYLDQQIISLENSLSNAEDIFKNIEIQEDLPMDSIALLYLMMNQIRNSN